MPDSKPFPVNCEIHNDLLYVSLGFLNKADKKAYVSKSECVASNVGDVIIDYDNQNRVVGIELVGFKYAIDDKAA